MKTGTIVLAIAGLAAVAGTGSLILRDREAPRGPGERPARSAALAETPAASSPARDQALSPQPAPAPAAAASVGPDVQLRELARGRARADLAATAAWLLTLSEADAAVATDAVLEEIGRDDIPAAILLAQALRRGVDDGRVEHMAQIWTEESPAAAVAWITSLAPGADRDRLLARAALVRVGHDPAEAVRLLSGMTDGSARDAAVAAAIARLRMYDPAKADTWEAVLAKPRSG